METTEQNPKPDATPGADEIERMASEGEYIPAGDSGGGAQQQAQNVNAEMLAGLYMICFQVVASRAGAHWALSEAEAKMLGESTGAVVDKYFPDLNIGVEAALVMTAAVVILPRYAQGQSLKAEADAKRKKQDAENDKPQAAA